MATRTDKASESTCLNKTLVSAACEPHCEGEYHEFVKTSLYGRTALIAAAFAVPSGAAEPPNEVSLDYSTDNPVSLVLKEKGWPKNDLKKDGIRVVWVQRLGCNKALAFMNAGSLGFGSTAGSATLLGRINGNPSNSICGYSNRIAVATSGPLGPRPPALERHKRLQP